MSFQDLNKMISPTFSIIVPVYNTQKYIARCLESCIYQSFENIEIIVVDDCGKDRAMQIAKEYAKQDKRIRIIQNPKNLGPFHSRIFGSENASGEYILFVDSDDFIDIKTCEKIKEALEGEYQKSGSKADICWFASKRLFSKKEEIFKPYNGVSLGGEVLVNNSFQWEIWGKAYKRELIQKVNEVIKELFVEDIRLLIGEDALKSFAINLFAKKSISLNEILYFYCDNPTSITKNRNHHKTALQNSEQLGFVIDFLNRYDAFDEAKENPSYQSIKTRVQEILKSHQEMWEYQAFLAHRFDDYLFAYPKTYFASLKLKKDYRRLCVRVFVYLITFGFVKV